MSKFTPGPWMAEFDNPFTAVGEGHLIKAADAANSPVALLWVGGGTKGKPRQKANAHLIKASPDMYEALDGIINVLTSGFCMQAGFRFGKTTLQESVHIANEALEKARGE